MTTFCFVVYIVNYGSQRVKYNSALRAYTSYIWILIELNKRNRSWLVSLRGWSTLIILLTRLIWNLEMTVCELTRPSRCSPTSKLRTHSSTRWSTTRQTSHSSKIGERSRSVISIRSRTVSCWEDCDFDMICTNGHLSGKFSNQYQEGFHINFHSTSPEIYNRG
jgi:hypothetical protein